MAIVGKREYWDETNPANMEIVAAGITDKSLKASYNLVDVPVYSMAIDSEIKLLFSEPKIEMVFDFEMGIGPTSDGPQIMAGIRGINWNPAIDPPATDGFLIGVLTFGAGTLGTAVLRIVDNVIEFLTPGPINPTGPTRFRIRSDDDGALVRLQVEIDVGSGYSELINAQYNDMPAVNGELGDNSISFLVGSATPFLEPGDYGMIDNITIDEKNVVIP